MNNLKNIPPIYYFNLDYRKDRRKYIENQFHKHEIKKFFRVNSSRYSVNNFNEWKSKIVVSKIETQLWFLATLVDRMQGIIDWYESNISETCLLVEDDICFDASVFWGFTWDTFVDNLPCNWECVQLHIIGEKFIQLNLSKWIRNNHSAACILINRSYAEKLIKLHYINKKFVLYDNYGYDDRWPKYHYQSVDFVLYQIGVTYSIPIFTTNYNFVSDGFRNGDINRMSKNCDIVLLDWWKNKKYQYENKDIFYINSEKVKDFILKINH